jgi:hypothetical protein
MTVKNMVEPDSTQTIWRMRFAPRIQTAAFIRISAFCHQVTAKLNSERYDSP